jgi:DNA-binding NtrC family response regulator
LESSASAPSAPENHINPHQLGENGNGGNGLRFREAKEKFVSEWEREYFVRALRSTNGNISRAAEKVGMYRQSFQQKMRELGISVAELGLKAEEE